MILKFGKFKGQSITQVPKDYLWYLLGQDWLRSGMRVAIQAVMAGTYVSPVGVPAVPHGTPYLPPDIHDRLLKSKRDGARWELSDAATEIDGLDVPDIHKSAVLQALLAVAQRLQS
jgi:hypothetical protein